MKILLLLLFSLPALAKDKPPYSYQDATLVGFRTVSTGASCSGEGNTTGKVDDDSVKATTTTSSSCTDTLRKQYTVSLGANTYVLEPVAPVYSIGIAAAFVKPNVLANQLPGARIKMRSEGRSIFVFDGKRESKFSVVEAK